MNEKLLKNNLHFDISNSIIQTLNRFYMNTLYFPTYMYRQYDYVQRTTTTTTEERHVDNECRPFLETMKHQNHS